MRSLQHQCWEDGASRRQSIRPPDDETTRLPICLLDSYHKRGMCHTMHIWMAWAHTFSTKIKLLTPTFCWRTRRHPDSLPFRVVPQKLPRSHFAKSCAIHTTPYRMVALKEYFWCFVEHHVGVKRCQLALLIKSNTECLISQNSNRNEHRQHEDSP